MCGGQQRAAYGNLPQREPDLMGVSEAWRIQSAADDPSRETTVSAWLVHDKTGTHRWWYVVACVHLRPTETHPEPQIRLPDATHELFFLALDPGQPLSDVDDWRETPFLLPLDLAHQFLARSDEHAEDLAELVVEDICTGKPIDSDYRGYWESVVDQTAEHLFYGCHPGQN